ncbi:MAG: hypothetical protein ABI824_18765 [Acidobacteriota bacterium]
MKLPYALLVVLAGSLSVWGQDDAGTPLVVSGFENSGSITTGYRFTDVTGYRPKYQELFGLNSGFRVLDFSLFGKAQQGQNRFADDYSLTLTGLGGEPFSNAQLTVRKSRIYDLRVNFMSSHYYWNRNDSAVLPNGVDGLTNGHNWATVRKLGSANLLVHATNNLRFTFELNHNTRDGMNWTTRAPDFYGSPSSWGSFARANPFYVLAPLSETSSRVTGGVDYTLHSWNLHYKLGLQRFEDAIQGQNATSPQRSINIDDPATAKELVNGIAWSDSRKLTTPVSEFSYTGKPVGKLQLRGGYLFYRYRGPASLDMSFDGVARTNSAGTTDAPYAVSLSTRATVTEPNHVIDQGLTYKLREWWSVLADYRYSRFTVDSNAQFRSVNGSVVATGDTFNRWIIGTHTADLNMMFTPISSLLVRAGIRYMKSDVEFLDSGVADATRSKRIKTVWPVASVYYQPSARLSIRADIEQTTNGTSYTRITPHTDTGGRAVIRVRPTSRLHLDKFFLEQTVIVRNSKLIDTDYRSTVRSSATTANYEFNDRASVFAGFSYDSLFASDFTSFLRGTAPFTNLAIRDQTVDRVWQGGLRLQPVRSLELSFSGNYVRTTGVGEITGEQPLYGPMKFPYATASIAYAVPRVGRLNLQLQRAYYSEQIVPGNNFGAKLLTIAYTRSF